MLLELSSGAVFDLRASGLCVGELFLVDGDVVAQSAVEE